MHGDTGHGDTGGANHRLDTGIQLDITDILRRARSTRHRVMLVLSGSPDWCDRVARAWVSGCNAVAWVGGSGMPASKVRQLLLGREYAAVVVDAHSGLHPDALAAVCGTVVAGGVLVLLTPPWEAWPALADPDYERLASYPHDWKTLPQHFIAHVQHSLAGVTPLHWHESGPQVPPLFPLPLPDLPVVVNVGPSSAQRECLARLSCDGVSVLLAGRGHGKSALLGFAAQQYKSQGKKVLLVAPSRAAVTSVFRHAGGELDFMAPDMLVQAVSSLILSSRDFSPQGLSCGKTGTIADVLLADVLLVDEAAAIAQPVLLQLLQHFPCALLATTTEGYEGTGQGFLLRFLRELDRHYPAWQRLALQEPVRWAKDDSLQRWLYRALLLDANEPVVHEGIDVHDPVFELLQQAQLARHPALLRDVYGLLRSAHYRTTPDDLRFLLDAPQLSLYRLQCAGHTVAVAWVVEEGSIDAPMAVDIAEGRRRPRGHLLVQTLAIHSQQPQYLRQRVARVVRIAVHTEYQGRGLGSQLLQSVIKDQERKGVKAVGSSFSATPEVLAFWLRNGFELVRVGHRRQAASAAPSALVLMTGQ